MNKYIKKLIRAKFEYFMNNKDGVNKNLFFLDDGDVFSGTNTGEPLPVIEIKRTGFLRFVLITNSDTVINRVKKAKSNDK